MLTVHICISCCHHKLSKPRGNVFISAKIVSVSQLKSTLFPQSLRLRLQKYTLVFQSLILNLMSDQLLSSKNFSSEIRKKIVGYFLLPFLSLKPERGKEILNATSRVQSFAYHGKKEPLNLKITLA